MHHYPTAPDDRLTSFWGIALYSGPAHLGPQRENVKIWLENGKEDTMTAGQVRKCT